VDHGRGVDLETLAAREKTPIIKSGIVSDIKEKKREQ